MQAAQSAIKIIQNRTLNEFIQTFFNKNITKLEKTEFFFTPLCGGRSEASLLRFSYENKTYVMRILPHKASLAERERQINLMLHASQNGVGPSVLFVTPQMDSMIMQFIEGTTTTPNTFQEAKAVQNFARLLRRLHSSPATAPLAVSPFLRFQNFFDNIVTLMPSFVSKIDIAKKIIENIKATLKLHPLPLVPTHLDIHSLNIMQEREQFILVDWVNGGLSDPFLDLATFIIFQDLETSCTEIFFKTYFGREATEAEWARIQILLPVRLLVIAVAMFYSSQQSYETQPLFKQQPPFDDFLREQPTGTLAWPCHLVGLIMLDHGIALANQQVFQEALNYLQKYK